MSSLTSAARGSGAPGDWRHCARCEHADQRCSATPMDGQWLYLVQLGHGDRLQAETAQVGLRGTQGLHSGELMRGEAIVFPCHHVAWLSTRVSHRPTEPHGCVLPTIEGRSSTNSASSSGVTASDGGGLIEILTSGTDMDAAEDDSPAAVDDMADTGAARDLQSERLRTNRETACCARPNM